MGVRARSRLLLVALAIAPLLLVGCADGPEERYDQALAAASDGEMAKYTTFFTKKSGEILRNAERANKRTQFYFIRDPFKVLPDGQIKEIEVEGNVAWLTVEARGGDKTVTMVRDDDVWMIDLLELPLFNQIMAGGR